MPWELFEPLDEESVYARSSPKRTRTSTMSSGRFELRRHRCARRPRNGVIVTGEPGDARIT
jgi:hypothetical protein